MSDVSFDQKWYRPVFSMNDFNLILFLYLIKKLYSGSDFPSFLLVIHWIDVLKDACKI